MMKRFLVVMLFALCQSSLFAGTVEDGFLSNETVTAAIKEARDNGYDVGEPTSMLLRGSCGFVGCYATYLVGAPVSTTGINTQTWSIMATVETLNGNVTKVTCTPGQ